MEIPACASKVMHGQPQPCESMNLERIPFQLYLTQQNVQRIDGNADHHISKPIITMMSCIKIVTKAFRRKTREIKER